VGVLAAIAWDPQIRGFLILLLAIVLLPGSVYLLLATNVGSRLAFLVAVAGLSGWLMLLGIMWTVTPSATGPKGRDPAWRVKGVVTGSLSAAAQEPLNARFPAGWEQLGEGDAQAAEVATAAGEFFGSDAGASFGYEASSDYIVGKAYNRGGEREGPFGVLNFRPFNVFHEPHYAALVVRPAVEQVAQPGQAPPIPRIDTSRPGQTVLLERDLGTRRLPVFFVALGSGIVFAVSLLALHRRDKAAMTARGLLPASG
jgi:hypothetical protein